MLDRRDLIGIPFEQADCWEVARRALAKFGVELPPDPAEVLCRHGTYGMALDPAYALRAGDVLWMSGADGDHIGVCLDAFSFVHGTRPESRVDRLAPYERAGKIRLRIRPWELCP